MSFGERFSKLKHGDARLCYVHGCVVMCHAVHGVHFIAHSVKLRRFMLGLQRQCIAVKSEGSTMATNTSKQDITKQTCKS